jgi:hypothetical protein
MFWLPKHLGLGVTTFHLRSSESVLFGEVIIKGTVYPGSSLECAGGTSLTNVGSVACDVRHLESHLSDIECPIVTEVAD